MLQDYDLKSYVFNEKPEEFFQWCLDKKLYKNDGGVYFKSRMKNYFLGEIDFTGLTAIVVYKKNRPVAIGLCEHGQHFTQAFTHEQLPKKNSKPKNLVKYDWGMNMLGFISLYVKEAHRNQGIAVTIVQRLEQLRIQNWIHETNTNNSHERFKHEFHELSIPVFQARELAFKIASKYMQHSYLVELSPKAGNYMNVMHELSQALIEKRSGEPYPIYHLRNRVQLNIMQALANPDTNYLTKFAGQKKQKMILS
jgi:GNAT superfamily N-acetyltransferase